MAEQRAKMVLMQRQQENNVMNMTPRIGGGPKIGGGTGSGITFYYSKEGPRFAAFSKMWPVTIWCLLPFILHTSF